MPARMARADAPTNFLVLERKVERMMVSFDRALSEYPDVW